jgi:hypothetical protein
MHVTTTRVFQPHGGKLSGDSSHVITAIYRASKRIFRSSIFLDPIYNSSS